MLLFTLNRLCVFTKLAIKPKLLSYRQHRFMIVVFKMCPVSRKFYCDLFIKLIQNI